MSRYDKKEKRAWVVYAFIFLLLTSGIFIGGYMSYRTFELEFRRQAENQISAIAELKANEMVNWRRERLVDAQSFYQNSVFSGLVERYFENPADLETKRQIVSRLEYYHANAAYDKICLLDTDGVHRLVIPETLEESKQADSHLTTQAAASLETGNIVLLDFQRDLNADGEIYISILIPIFSAQEGNRPLGVLSLHINPETYLYPYINRWPIPSDTAETLLVRRDGTDILFLNQARFEEDAALNLRIPLTATEVPAVRAVLGETGLVEGMDYRGQRVIADLRSVPNSSWFLISKVDIDEVYAPLRERLWQTLLIVGMAILLSGFGLVTFWRQQRILAYRVKLEAAEKVSESEEKFRKAFLLSPDAININRLDDGRYISINNGFSKIMGYAANETIGKTSLELNVWADPQDRKRLVDGLNRDGEVINLEAHFRTKSGEIKYGLMSASILELNGTKHIISITRDITERRQAEEVLRQSEENLSITLRSIGDGVIATDSNGLIVNMNLTAERYCGWTLSEVKGKSLGKAFHIIDAETRRKVENPVARVLADGQTVGMANHAVLISKTGVEYQISDSAAPIKDAQGKIVGVVLVFSDVTENYKAIEKMRASEANFADIFQTVSDGIAYTSLDGTVLSMNASLEKILELPKEQIIGRNILSLTRDMLSAENISAVMPILTRLIRGLKVEAFEVKYKNKILEILATTNKASRRLTGVVRDVTERKRAEEALKESQAIFSSFLEHSPVYVFFKDRDIRSVMLSKNFEQMLGMPIRDLLGKTMDELFPSDLAKSMVADDLQILNEGRRVEIVEELNGRVYETTKFPVLKDGEPYMLAGFTLDITERKHAEEALRESESRFRTLFEQAAVGVAQLDTTTGRFIRVNQKYCDILGYTRQEMLNLDFQTITHPADLEADLSNMRRLVLGEIREFGMEKRYYCKDGCVIWVSLTVSPLWAEGEQPSTHIAVVQDITERKRAEEALEKRIIALTQPLENAEGITFGDLFNIEDIQRIQDDFALATGVASIITQVDGTPITVPSGFCRLCNDIIRRTEQGYLNCRKSDAALGKLSIDGPIIQPCMSGGLWDAGAGISVGGRQIANWLIGQVRDETQTEEKMLEYARSIGVDEQAFLDAFAEVPAMSKEKFEQISHALFTLANQLSAMAYQNVQQARFIAERKRVEAALLESEDRFRTHYDNAAIGLYRTTPDGRILMLNPAGARMLGFESFEEISKRNLEEADYEATRKAFREKIERDGAVIGMESNWTRKDGSTIFVRESAKAIRDANGKIVYYDGSFEDISGRVQAESALRESERLYRKMNENSPLGMHFYALQEDARLIFSGANPAADKLLGVDHLQFIGKTIEEAFPSLVNTEVPQRYHEAAVKGIPWVTEQIEYADSQIEGAFEVRAFQTTPGNMVAVFSDITLRKQAEEKILNLNLELEQRVRERTLQLENTNKELEAFSYSVSHDLRAPLRGIDGWSQALMEDYQEKLDEQGREYIERVRSETQRMGHLIDDMLQLSRLTRVEMVKEPVNLSAIARSIIGRLERDNPRRQAEFIVETEIIAMGDPHLLEAALVNLLDNAFKFTSKREHARIEFGQTDRQGQRVFFIRDNGAGFDMAYAQKMFGAFQRMHKASEFPGTGVGLAIVQRIIHRHGGQVWAEAQVGHGAKFYFTLEEV